MLLPPVHTIPSSTPPTRGSGGLVVVIVLVPVGVVVVDVTGGVAKPDAEVLAVDGDELGVPVVVIRIGPKAHPALCFLVPMNDESAEPLTIRSTPQTCVQSV